ncbi:hypothetical protein DPMN_033102 [Dreissena polymorpha]|uniref:Uncharacterized protein n=1 Tax=Dreissena polymorpha TaxID=45954 RepID=A0A9D4RKV4_DREPO|nr:hypothetical protein DPMN_033102 [Dreissena polymorpha]
MLKYDISANGTIFELIRNIIKTNVLINVPEDWSKHQPTGTIIELVKYIIGTYLLTKNASPLCGNLFQMRMPRLPGGNFFQATETIFKLVQDMIGTYRLTKFYKERTINVASRVLTRKHAPGPDIIGTKLLIKCHDDLTTCVSSRPCVSSNQNNFKFVKNIIGENLLTKCYEDWTIYVANVDAARRTTYDGQNAITKAHH